MQASVCSMMSVSLPRAVHDRIFRGSSYFILEDIWKAFMEGTIPDLGRIRRTFQYYRQWNAGNSEYHSMVESGDPKYVTVSRTSLGIPENQLRKKIIFNYIGRVFVYKCQQPWYMFRKREKNES